MNGMKRLSSATISNLVGAGVCLGAD